MAYLRQAYRSKIKHGTISAVEREDVLTLLDNEDQSFKFLELMPVGRSFVRLKNLAPHVADVLRYVLINGSIRHDLNNAGIKICYKMGWLHVEPMDFHHIDVFSVFPTRLHAKYASFSLSYSDIADIMIDMWSTIYLARLHHFP